MKVKHISLLCLIFLTGWLQAQTGYFGGNKPSYESFDFRVYQTPHFEIYHYLKNENALNEFANYSEHWYNLHQRVLSDTIYGKNPIIIYNNHADFQQTNAISGAIGVGTGGVTEAFKNRVVMPFAATNQQTSHVLGHELVHAFQYNLVLQGDSTSLRSLSNLPLFMVEGMAEYMSIGSVDAHTSMWMRDAVLADKVPTIQEMANPQKYFPYRYGQAFWAFVTGLRGDEIIEPYLSATAKYGLQLATQRVMGMSLENLSSLWMEGLKNHYKQYLPREEEEFIGRELIAQEEGGKINIAPNISPNGRYIIFLSEKDLFSIDLFLANTSGEIIRKVASSTKESHIDDFNYIESAGTWAPDSKRFAFVGFSKGRNILIIKDVESGKTVQEAYLEGVEAFSNPAWSPDGRKIVVSGLVEGQPNLYAFDVRTERVEQITDDVYSEALPSWSPDGRFLVYSSDYLSMERGRTNGKLTFNLAIRDMETGETQHLEIFPGADNLNPVFDSDNNVVFLSNRDGYRNVYKYVRDSQKVYQLTDYMTGVSGITHYAPAISIANDSRRERLVYTYFTQNKYRLYKATPDQYLMKEVRPDSVNFEAATLPRVNERATALVDQQIRMLDQMPDYNSTAFQEVRYEPEFQLDYIGGSAGVGVGTSNTFGTTTGLAGAVNFQFSDILGNNSLFGSLAMNGQVQDFGGAFAYINRENRFNWGGSFSHIPFRTFGGQSFTRDTLDTSQGQIPVIEEQFSIDRIFEDKASVFAFLPFSTTLRVEADASYARYSFSREQFDFTFLESGQLIDQDRDNVDSPFSGFNLIQTGAALVGDNSQFGLTAPLIGHRFRFGVNKYFGEFDYLGATLDYRRYVNVRPVTFAFRGFHFGRYGQGNEEFPLYLGSPWYIRGFNDSSTEQLLLNNGGSIDQLFGSKLLVGNFEVRLPFTGPKQIAAIQSGFLFSDLNLFFDAGVAWFDFEQFEGDVNRLEGTLQEANPVFSTGLSLRVNLFGALVLEPYYAIPINGGEFDTGVFGFNFFPGW